MIIIKDTEDLVLQVEKTGKENTIEDLPQLNGHIKNIEKEVVPGPAIEEVHIEDEDLLLEIPTITNIQKGIGS